MPYNKDVDGRLFITLRLPVSLKDLRLRFLHSHPRRQAFSVQITFTHGVYVGERSYIDACIELHPGKMHLTTCIVSSNMTLERSRGRIFNIRKKTRLSAIYERQSGRMRYATLLRIAGEWCSFLGL